MHARPGVVDGKYVFEYDVGLWTLGSIQVLRERKTGNLKTCKTVSKNKVRAPVDATYRLQQLLDIHHPHLCSVDEVLEDQAHIYLVSDKLPGGDVADWMVRVLEEGNWLQEQTAAEYIRQALIAIAHVHAHGVEHRDLRPSCIGLSSKMPDAVVKVMDFGLVSTLDPEDMFVQRNPSPYAAPEVLTGQGQGALGAPDVWSIGAIAHSLLVGHPPKQDKDPWMAGGGLLSWRAESDAWSDRSAASGDFIRCLLRPAEGRPTAARALQHPWLKGVVSLDPIQWSLGTQAMKELHHRLLCYMLAVLLLPDCMKYRDFFNLRQAFVRSDTDRDGLVARHVVQRLLLRDGVTTSEAAAAALDVVDVRGTDQLDLCAAACAELLCQKFAVADDSMGAIKLAPVMLTRMFAAYGDPQRLVMAVSGITKNLCTSTTRDMEAHAGVKYDDILSSLPQDGIVDGKTLTAALTQTGGHGTPLQDCVPEDGSPDGSWGESLGIEGLGSLVSHVFKTCGLAHEKLRGQGYRSVLGGR